MHMQGTPRTMQRDPVYGDVVAEVLEYLRRRRDALLAAGIQRDRIALDPGIGFGKTTAHNLQLLANAWQFHALGCPLLIGHSRKRFVAEAAMRPVAEASETAAGHASAIGVCRRGIARPARSAWRCRSPGRGYKFSACTMWRPFARPCCCFKRPVA